MQNVVEDLGCAPGVDTDSPHEPVNHVEIKKWGFFGADVEFAARVLHDKNESSTFGLDDLMFAVLNNANFVEQAVEGLHQQLVAILEQPHFVDFVLEKHLHAEAVVHVVGWE